MSLGALSRPTGPPGGPTTGAPSPEGAQQTAPSGGVGGALPGPSLPLPPWTRPLGLHLQQAVPLHVLQVQTETVEFVTQPPRPEREKGVINKHPPNRHKPKLSRARLLP